MTALLATVPGVRIESVKVGERARKDYGDLTSLKDSIAEHGLLQPIVLLPDDYLLCGGRRLEACKQLGWEAIPFVRVADQGDALSRIKAERDENTCRKDMTFSELLALGARLEELEAPLAQARQAEGRRLGGEVFAGREASNSQELKASGYHHQVDDEVGPALGMSRATYGRAKHIVRASQDPAEALAVRETAQAAIAELDGGSSKVLTAYKKVSAARDDAALTAQPRNRPQVERAAQITELAATGMTSGQIGKQIGIGEEQVRAIARLNKIDITADIVMRNSRRGIDGDRVINACVMDASNLISPSVIEQVRFADLNRESLGEWVSSLSDSIRALQALKRDLEKELNHG